MGVGRGYVCRRLVCALPGGLPSPTAIRRSFGPILHTPPPPPPLKSTRPPASLNPKSFWRQCHYVRRAPFALYDDEGALLAVSAGVAGGGSADAWEENEAPAYHVPVDELASRAFDRLVRLKLMRMANRAQEQAEKPSTFSLPPLTLLTMRRGIRAMLSQTFHTDALQALAQPRHEGETAAPDAATQSEAPQAAAALPPVASPEPSPPAVASVNGPRTGEDGGVVIPTASISLTKRDLAPCFVGARRDLDAAFELLDLDGDGRVTRCERVRGGCAFALSAPPLFAHPIFLHERAAPHPPTTLRALPSREEFVNCLHIMTTAWYSSGTALGSYGGLNGALRIMADVCLFLACFIIVLSVFRIDFSSVWLPLSTVIISLSFAVGPLVQGALSNLFFVTVSVPFENGDMVILEGIANGANMSVQAINFTQTEFVECLTGKRVVVPNMRIANSVVTNLRRSPVASFYPKFTVPAATPSAQLDALRAAVGEFLMSRPFDWKPGATMFASYIDTNKLELSWGLTHLCGWSEGGKVFPALCEFNLHVLSCLRELDMLYKQPALPVEVSGLGSDVLLQQRVEQAERARGADPS